MLLPIYSFVHLYQEDLLISVIVHRPFIPDRVQLYFWNQPYYLDQNKGALPWVGLAGNVKLVSPTTHTQFTIGHQFWKWIKPAQKQMNKSWLKWASASLPKNVKCMKLESCLLMLRLYWYIVNLQWCFKYYMYFYIAVNLTAK